MMNFTGREKMMTIIDYKDTYIVLHVVYHRNEVQIFDTYMAYERLV